MIFLAILDCNDLGLKKSTMLCSKYLNQIDHRAFIGNLSTNNFDNFKEELIENITELNSISVFRVKKDKYKLIAHFGHTNRLDKNGLYAFKLKDLYLMKKNQSEYKSFSTSLMKELVGIAGLFHDLGKSSIAFQNLLRSAAHINPIYVNEKDNSLSETFIPLGTNAKKDQQIKEETNWHNLIRHEVLSALIIKELLNNGFVIDGKKVEFTDFNFFKVLSNKEQIELLFENAVHSFSSSNNRNSILGKLKIDLNKINSKKQSNSDINVINEVDQYFQKIFTEFNYNRKNGNSFGCNENRFLINCILFLVLSHHKLPSNKKKNNYSELCKFSIANHFNESHFAYSHFYFSFLMDFHRVSSSENSWNTELSQSCEKINSLIDIINTSNNEFFTEQNNSQRDAFFDFLVNFGRFSLIAGDYYHSSNKTLKDDFSLIEFDGNKLPCAIANIESRSFTKELCEQLKIADTLEEHLIGVSKESKQVFTDLFLDGFINESHYTTLRKEDRDTFIKKKIEEGEKNTNKNFAWQYDILNKLNKEEYKEKPFFCVNVAGTGTGKTYGNLISMLSLSDHNRISCALGLRTLTLQSYKSYFNVDEIKDATGLFMGQSIESALDGEEQKKISSSNTLIKKTDVNLYNGSDAEASLDKDSFEIIEAKKTTGSYEFKKEYFRNDWFKIYKDSEKKLIHTPICVMTVDNIIRSVQYGKGHNLINAYRSFNSDLIIDEVDDYSFNDLYSISKLVFVCGLSGRNVLISSATVNEVIVKELQEVFESGVKKRACFLNKDIEIGSALISQYSDINKVFFNKSTVEEFNSTFKSDYDSFLSELKHEHCKLVDEQKGSEERTTTQNNNIEKIIINNEEIDDILNNGTEIDAENHYFKTVLDKTVEYHNNTYINVENKKISFGFVRFDIIQTSQKFSNYIQNYCNDVNDGSIADDYQSKYGEKYKFFVVNYHSKFLAIDRFLTEDFLNTFLKRKNVSKNVHDVCNVPSLQKDFISNYNIYEKFMTELEGYDNIVVIVSSSKILEVGRDHDYDWAILEPQSVKSLIQCKGRVRRHRTVYNDLYNIGVLGLSFSYIRGKNRSNRNNSENIDPILNEYCNGGICQDDRSYFFTPSFNKKVLFKDNQDTKITSFFSNFYSQDSQIYSAKENQNRREDLKLLKQNSLNCAQIPANALSNKFLNDLNNLDSLILDDNKNYQDYVFLKNEQMRIIEHFSDFTFFVPLLKDVNSTFTYVKQDRSHDGNYQTKIQEHNITKYHSNICYKINGNFTNHYSFRGDIYSNFTFILKSDFAQTKTRLSDRYLDLLNSGQKHCIETTYRNATFQKELKFEEFDLENSVYLFDFIFYDNKTGYQKLKDVIDNVIYSNISDKKIDSLLYAVDLKSKFFTDNAYSFNYNRNTGLSILK